MPLFNVNRRALRYAVVGSATAGTIAYYWSDISFFGKASVRVSRTAFTVARLAWDYQHELGAYWKLQERGPLSQQLEEEYQQAKSRTHQRAARKLLGLFQTNGGIYIKLGQHLAAMDFIVPNEYCHILSRLHSQAPTSTPEDVALTFLEEYLVSHPKTSIGYRSIWDRLDPRRRRGCKIQRGVEVIQERFESFDWKPIGSASLAQVHRAKLKGGEQDVAVKVQHYRTMGFATLDIATAAVAVKWIRRVFPQFEFGWLAEEMRVNLPREMNFVQEGLNSERLVRSMDPQNPSLIVPKVHWDCSSRRILVMEYIGGPNVCKINDVAHLQAMGINLRKLSERLTKAYSEMIFLHGFVHCDPHPGNILARRRRSSWLLRDNFDIVLLDHGLYRELSDEFRVNYAKLWKSVIDYDEPEMARVSALLGAPTMHRLFSSCLTHRSWERMSSVNGLGAAYSLKELDAIRARAPQFVEKVSQLLNALPRDILLLLKTNDLLRSIERTLQAEGPWPTSRSFLIMARYCTQAIYQHDHRSALWLWLNIGKYRLFTWGLRYWNYWHQFWSFFQSEPDEGNGKVDLELLAELDAP